MTRPLTQLALALLLLLEAGAVLLEAAPAPPDPPAAPFDLWTDEVMRKIRDRQTLAVELVPRDGYSEVFYDSEVGDADWADSEPPYELHAGDTIRIHGYLAAPAAGGPYPALVVGHGHGGHGDPDPPGSSPPSATSCSPSTGRGPGSPPADRRIRTRPGSRWRRS